MKSLLLFVGLFITYVIGILVGKLMEESKDEPRKENKGIYLVERTSDYAYGDGGSDCL